MQNNLKVLIIGDIIGKGARNAFIDFLPTLKEKYPYDIIVVNCENVTHGRGLNKNHYNLLNSLGITVMTMGNHVLDNKDIYSYIDKTTNLIVPGNINYKDPVFNNHKEAVIEYNGYTIKVINELKTNNQEGFELVKPEDYFKSIYDGKSIYIVDYHSEYTMDKNAFGYFVDGKASLVYGTHTHVQTADERILPLGTGYISDVGMCGAKDSIIGYGYQEFVNNANGAKEKTHVSEQPPYMINGLYATINLESKECVSINRINELIKC